MTSSRHEGETPARIPAPVWAGTFLVALSGVALEVALVRIFALLFRYHHLYLLVSVAVCGLGVGGLLRTYLPQRWCRLWISTLLFGATIPAVLLILFRSPLAARLVEAWWLPLVLLVPFLCAGLFLSEVFRRHAALGGALYFADLAGAALAAILVVALLQWLGGIGVCLLLSAVLCTAAAMLARLEAPRALVPCIAAAACSLGLLVANERLRWVDLPTLPPDADPSLTKPLLREMQPGSGIRIVASRWSAFARTDMTDEGDPDARYLYTDGDTPTHMIRFDGDLRKVAGLQGQIGFLPYRVGRPQAVLCIGPGGGMDVLLALLGGARHIVGAEVNGDIVRLVEEYRQFNGGIYHRPGVSVSVADGRSFTARQRGRFDLIYSALTQSATGSRAGIALAESYIHTQEAFGVYLDHLTDSGIYALIVQEEPVLVRAFLTAVAVLTQRGESMPEACRHLLAAAIPPELHATTPYRRILLVRRRPFTPAEADRAVAAIREMGLNSLFVPHILEDVPPFAGLASGKESLQEFVAGFSMDGIRLNVAPRTDDQPFFLDLSPEMPGPLVRLLRGTALAVLAAGVWLALRRLRSGVASGLRGLGGAFYFSLLGAGFMLVEIPLIQQFVLFLGHPVLSLSVVLFSLLIGTAIGSRYSQRWPVLALPWRVALAAGLAALLVLTYRAVLPDVFQALLSLSLEARCAVTAALVVPLGCVLGVPFPSGIRWAEADDSRQVPWLWGLNGLASVLGSALAMALAWKTGFSAALLAGAGAYAAAAVLAASAPGLMKPAR